MGHKKVSGSLVIALLENFCRVWGRKKYWKLANIWRTCGQEYIGTGFVTDICGLVSLLHLISVCQISGLRCIACGRQVRSWNVCRIELQDDKSTSYIRALRDCVQPGVTRIVVCVLPNNRKDRYDALKIFLCVEDPGDWNTFSLNMVRWEYKGKDKDFPYSLPSVGPGADPGVQAVSQQVTVSHPPGCRLPLLSARHVVTVPAAEHHRFLASTKLYWLVTEAHRCERLARGCYAAFAPSRI